MSYAKLPLSETEFQTVRGALSAQRQAVAEKSSSAVTPAEADFYRQRLAAYDELLLKCDEILVADTSQDVDPEDDDV